MSNIGGNRVWTHPPDQLLDFSRNCTVWGAWLGAIMTPDIWSDDMDESHPTLGANLQKNVALLKSALPPNWLEPTYSEAIAWWIYRQQPDFPAAECDFKHEIQYTGSSLSCEAYWSAQVNLSELVVKEPSQKCQEQMCMALSRILNPDIIGIGVVVSYVSEAILLTIFVGFYLLDTFTKRRRWQRRENTTTSASASDIDIVSSWPPPPVDRLDSLIDICRHCVKPFFDTAAFFCISMLIAALHLVSVLHNERQDFFPSPARFVELPNMHIRTVSSFYDINHALFAIIFSAFAMCILGFISDQGKRRRRLRRTTMVLAYILSIPLFTLSMVIESHSISDGWTNQAAMCSGKGSHIYTVSLQGQGCIAIVLPLLWMFQYWFCLSTNSRYLSWFLNGSVVLGFLGMWIGLIMSLVTRNKIIRGAGKADKSNELGFGQVLAIFAWTPTIMALGYMFAFGAQTAYNGEMTVDYQAKPAVSEVLPRDNHQGAESHE